LHGFTDNLTAWHQSIYYSVFFTAIVWAFIRGTGKAAIELLLFTSFAILLIPFTSLIAWLEPETHLWFYADSLSIGVDLTALILSIGFLLMANSTARRVRFGDPYSVWSRRHIVF